MIKYIGSKRRLVPTLGQLIEASGAKTAVDLFAGTTRVGQEFKRRGVFVTSVDTARYSEVFGACYIALDASLVNESELADVLTELNELPGRPGYFTETFCIQSRFFRPDNGERIDAIRDALDREYRASPLFPVLLTSLIEAADRVDSTTGVQMAYLKKWAPRALKPLDLRPPVLLEGGGRAVLGDALEVVHTLDTVDVAYLDPPYNQHRYFTNYHIWETLVRWDQPSHYGVACKRSDARSDETKSVFNKKREMPEALRRVINGVRARTIILSYNNESWITLRDLQEMLSERGHVATLAFDSKRYVGAQIGIYSPGGQKVGRVSHLRNLEYVLISGERALVEGISAPFSRDAAALSQAELFAQVDN